MKPKTLIVLTGVALAAGVGAANAGEPMELTAAQMDRITAGAYSNGFEFYAKKGFFKDKVKRIIIIKKVLVGIKGHYADAGAGSAAYGKNAETDTFTYTEVGDGYATSVSESDAAVDYFDYTKDDFKDTAVTYDSATTDTTNQ